MHATPSPSSPPPPTYAPYGQPGNAAAPPPRPKSPPPPSDWDPAPPRSRAGLIVRHLCTLLYFPFHVLLLIALFAAVYAFGLVGELLIFFDKPMLRLLEWALDPFPFRPRWWVTPRELRHERAGDPEFYRGWVGEQLEQARSPRSPRRSSGSMSTGASVPADCWRSPRSTAGSPTRTAGSARCARCT